MNNIISGKQIASDITNEIKNKIDVLKLKHSTVPSLAVILVGTKMQSETSQSFIDVLRSRNLI